MSHHHSRYSIWFFTGLLLFIYGVMIAGAGALEFNQPSAGNIKMAELHINFWWGLFLLVLGAVYLWIYAPSRQK